MNAAPYISVRLPAARPGVRVAVTVLSLWAIGLSRPLLGQETSAEPTYDPGAPAQARNQLTRSLAIGAKLQLDYEFRRQWDLTNGGEDDRSTLQPEPSLAVAFTPNSGMRAFASLEFSRRFAFGRAASGDRDLEVELRQAYLQFSSRGDGRYSVRLGRQRFKDRREWIYDAELDGMRFRYDTEAFDMELSLTRGREPGVGSLKEESNTLSLEADLRPAPKIRVGGYAMLRDAFQGGGASPLHLGLRSSGDLSPDFEYWTQVGRLSGWTGSRARSAIALDVGLTYQPDLTLRPSLTIAYAYGSGDRNPQDEVDGAFRQTGLQGNQGRLAGVTSLKYYGELLDPELSNLAIATAAVGVRPSRRSSAELILHRYRQPVAHAELRDANVEVEPTGRNRDIGSEIDLVLGFREIRNVTLKLVLGWFRPGPAFEDPAESSAFGEFTIDFRI